MHWISLYLLGSSLTALLIEWYAAGTLLMMLCIGALFLGGVRDAARK